MVEPCYDGPGGTAGVGACTAGTRTCADDGSGFGACIGQVLPGAEDCTTLADENCDGSVQGCTDGHRWSRQFPGPRGQYVVAVATDADASVVVGGQFEATIDLGGGVLAASAPIDQDGFLGKLDAAGNHLWSLRFGDHGRECALSVTVDGAGDVLATGYFQSPTSFGGNTLQHVFGSDVFLVKLGPAGNHLWSRRYGSTGEQIGHEVATDAAGNVYLVGAADGPIDLGGGNLTGTGSNDIFVAKIDAGGSHVWSKRFSAPAHQYGRNVAVTPAGDVVILGIGEGTVDFGGGPLVSAGSEDVFMARFDTAGTLVWSRRVGGPAFDTAGDVTFDAQGNVLLAAQFQETIDLGGGPLTSAGSLDVVVAKLDPLGELVWSRRYGGTEREDAFAIAVDGAGDIVLGATSMGVVDFGGGPLAAAGSRDACVVKLDSGGDHVWSQRFGGAGVDHLGGLSIDPLDNIDVGGQFSQTVDFGGGPFMAELGDGYLVQLSP